MKIVVDVNILLSTLIRNSATRKILLTSGFEFYFPETSLQKIIKYKNYILHKSEMKENEYNIVLSTLFKHIELIPDKEIKKSWDKAKEIMELVDEEDVIFIAAALNIKDSVIWSDDKDFEKQKAVKVIKTKDIIELL